MATVAGGVFALVALVSLGVCALGYHTYQRWNEPGVVAFAAFVVLLGGGSLVGAVASLQFGAHADETAVWTQAGLLSLAFWAVPWALFGLQYTGRFTRAPKTAVAVLYVPAFVVCPFLVYSGLRNDEATILAQLVGTVLFVYVFLLLALGIYLVGQTTYRYGHLSVGEGATIIAIPMGYFLLANMTSTIASGLTGLEVAVLNLAAVVLPTVFLGVALFRYDTFESTPAVGEIGERAIARETDDLVFIVDDNDRIIKLNESAVETLDASRRYSLGASLPAVLGHDIETVRNRGSVTIETVDGPRQYDPEITSITDQHDRRLGTMLSLRDVTERELREQRLSVLNRVLRHNLRNRIEVIKAHTEMLDELAGPEECNGHVDTITDTADEIAGLGERARSIDRFVATTVDEERVDIVAVVQEVLAALDADQREVPVTRHLPASATVVTNRAALRAALESSLDNALTYADARVSVGVTEEPDGYQITIADDGPGIPDAELAAIEEGTETPLQHGTGLGLWQLRWAVTTLGGDLSFDTDGGTTVDIWLPVTDEELAAA